MAVFYFKSGFRFLAAVEGKDLHNYTSMLGALAVCYHTTQWRSTSGIGSGYRQIRLGDAKKLSFRQKWKPRSKRKILSRSEEIDPDKTDWGSVMPTAESFNPAVVPLGIRMGRPRYNRTGDVPPDARGNIELLKIPNFFHLTPVAIEKHCKALKEYCTEWPKDARHLPIRVTTISHVYAGPSVKHPDSRKVKLEISLKDMELDSHARQKLIRLAGDKYNPANDELTIITGRCPTRVQNKEYAYYLLAAIYHEAWKMEDWEKEADAFTSRQIAEELDLVRQELKPDLIVEKGIKRRFYRVVGDRVVRFNNVGHPFVVEMRKYGIVGGLSRDLLEGAKREWQTIQHDQIDKHTFDNIVWPRRGRQI